MKKLVLLIALLVAIPVMLVGCGKSESAAIKDSIKGFVAAYNDEDFDKCTDYLVGINDLTKPAVALSLGGFHLISGDIEVNSIEDISVEGSSATATVNVTVMGMEQERELSLTKVDGTWKFAGGDLFSSQTPG